MLILFWQVNDPEATVHGVLFTAYSRHVVLLLDIQNCKHRIAAAGLDEIGLLLQDWTKQENEDAEGVVSFSYRTKPEEPPDVQTIQKQMAIVAWQPGPNRIVQVPSQVRHFLCTLSAKWSCRPYRNRWP